MPHVLHPSDIDDLIVVERNDADRTLIGMSGRYELRGWRDSSGNPREFDCRVINISPQAIGLSAPVTGTVGEWVIVRFEQFGTFEGPILKKVDRGFVMRIVATNEERGKVAATIAWINDKTMPEGRRHRRVVPRNPDSTLSLADGRIMGCQVLNYSASGAALSAEVTPAIGEILKVGRVIGRVVRHFNGGFAVRFTDVQDVEFAEKLLVRFTA